ncbi:GIY-YIG nuclease family protein, partial [uncultured Agitococcus sp.]|uniref:GIY-YIG nuclease family protein n=1 Tax=uncultured Agitococcus sp. TaxID=1506599 RepID=UPI00261B6B0B
TYLVRQVGTTKIKIGRSSKPKERINTISHQCGSYLETLVLIPKDIEQELHLKFCYLRHLGEWFIDNGDIVEWVERYKPIEEV